MTGAVKREEREYERLALGARWIGALAQVDPRKHPSVDRLMGRKKSGASAMSAAQINTAMRAWAARAHRA